MIYINVLCVFTLCFYVVAALRPAVIGWNTNLIILIIRIRIIATALHLKRLLNACWIKQEQKIIGNYRSAKWTRIPGKSYTSNKIGISCSFVLLRYCSKPVYTVFKINSLIRSVFTLVSFI